ASRSIAGEVETDVSEARSLEPGDDAIPAIGLHQPIEIRGRAFDAGDLAVIPDPNLPEPLGPEDRLGALDPRQDRAVDPRAERDPRREAGALGLVPGAESQMAADVADVLLGDAGLEKGGDRPGLGSRLHPGSEIAGVVGDSAIGADGEPFAVRLGA